jgi:8-oxo-dGTP pyrophosphatase MutT (NUDIX family)
VKDPEHRSEQQAHAGEPEMVIPFDRLPPGFAERIADPPAAAAQPKPAATAVLMRDSVAGPEVLLLRRLRSAGFVPGAWVFPGGRVDPADSAPSLVELLGHLPRGPDASFWLAAVREVFEETGVLLARGADDAPDGLRTPGTGGAPGMGGTPAAGAAADDRLAYWRSALLAGEAGLAELLRDIDAVPDLGSVVYCSHWITPVAEPKRYDTRFFLAALPHGANVSIDEREMSDALWLSPEHALRRFAQGELPMVFPTVKTIQRLAGYASVQDALDAFRSADVAPILPRLVTTGDGVGIVLPGEG